MANLSFFITQCKFLARHKNGNFFLLSFLKKNQVRLTEQIDAFLSVIELIEFLGDFREIYQSQSVKS